MAKSLQEAVALSQRTILGSPEAPEIDSPRLRNPLAVQGHARRLTIGAGVLIQLHDIDLVAGVGDVDAHAAGELVAGDAGVDGLILRRSGHAAIRIVGRLVPRAFDLAGLVGQLGGGIDPVVLAGAAEVLREVAPVTL